MKKLKPIERLRRKLEERAKEIESLRAALGMALDVVALVLGPVGPFHPQTKTVLQGYFQPVSQAGRLALGRMSLVSNLDPTKPLPAPVPGGVPVWEQVIADLEPMAVDEIGRMVIADMKARDQFGREKYGQPLMSEDGRDPLIDAYQEGLDKVVYLFKRFIQEPTDMQILALYKAEVQVLVMLRRRITFAAMADVPVAPETTAPAAPET